MIINFKTNINDSVDVDSKNTGLRIENLFSYNQRISEVMRFYFLLFFFLNILGFDYSTWVHLRLSTETKLYTFISSLQVQFPKFWLPSGIETMRQHAIQDYVSRNSSCMNSSPFRSNLYILSSFRITFIGSSRNNVGVKP